MRPLADQTDWQIFPDACLRDFSAQVFMHFGVPKLPTPQTGRRRLGPKRPAWHRLARRRPSAHLLRNAQPRSNQSPGQCQIVRQTASIATMDGDNGLGLVVGPKANEIAMDKAERHGSGWVSVRNTNHFGIAGYYPLKALERDLIGWAMTNSTKLVAPLWGAERMLGTNPIAVAFPGLDEPPSSSTWRQRHRLWQDRDRAAGRKPSRGLGHRQRRHVPRRAARNDRRRGAVPLGGRGTRRPQRLRPGCAGGHPVGVFSGANWGPFAPPFALRQEIPSAASAKASATSSAPCGSTASSTPMSSNARSTSGVAFPQHQTGSGTTARSSPVIPEREAVAIRSTSGIPLLKLGGG